MNLLPPTPDKMPPVAPDASREQVKAALRAANQDAKIDKAIAQLQSKIKEFSLNEKQEEAKNLIGTDARHIMLEGGGRSSKTFLLCWIVAMRALAAPGSRHAILRFRFNHVISSIWYDTWPKMMKLAFPGVKYEENKTNWFIRLPGGSEVWFGGIDDKDRTDKILGNEYCVDPESKILTADLRWIPAKSVEVGQELIGFDESLDGQMRLRRSIVERHETIETEKYRVITSRGETIVSKEHKFVSYHDDRRANNFRSLSWKRACELKPGDKIRFACDPWEVDRSFEGGWASGLYDGEGWISGGSVGVAQNAGKVLDRMKSILSSRGIDYRDHAGSCHHLMARGLWASLKAMGVFRPVRLMDKAHLLWEDRYGFNGRGSPTGHAPGKKAKRNGAHCAEILKIEKLGNGPVISMSTSTKTFIADGFPGHNCTIFFNECSQIQYPAVQTVLTRLAQRVEYTMNGERKLLRLKALYDQNPTSKGHWTYKLWHKKQDPESGNPLLRADNYASLLMNPGDNRENIAIEYIEELEAASERQKKRFLRGEYSEDNPNCLFPDDIIDRNRVIDGILPEFVRLVVAVDPSGSGDKDNADNDAIGIIVAAIGTDGKAYILEDLTVKAGPAVWGRIAVSAYDRHMASILVAEKNFGGEMVRSVIESAAKDQGIRSPAFKFVTASRGKMIRAEPIAALYENNKVRHNGYFRQLEDEMASSSTYGYLGSGSPNRLDALVWAVTELFPGIVKQESDKTNKFLGKSPFQYEIG